jgi:hypothetical protein
MFNPLTVFSANQFKIYRFDILLMRNADLGRKQPEKNRKRPRSGEQNCRKQKLWNSDITDAKSPLQRTEKHPDFQVTVCLHFVTTTVNFAYIKS